MRKKKNMKRKAGAVLLSVMMLSALMTAGMQISFAVETPTGAESGSGGTDTGLSSVFQCPDV